MPARHHCVGRCLEKLAPTRTTRTLSKTTCEEHQNCDSHTEGVNTQSIQNLIKQKSQRANSQSTWLWLSDHTSKSGRLLDTRQQMWCCVWSSCELTQDSANSHPQMTEQMPKIPQPLQSTELLLRNIDQPIGCHNPLVACLAEHLVCLYLGIARPNLKIVESV